MPLFGVLCFVEADWPLIGGSFTVEAIHVLWPKKAVERLLEPGPLAENQLRAARDGVPVCLTSVDVSAGHLPVICP